MSSLKRHNLHREQLNKLKSTVPSSVYLAVDYKDFALTSHKYRAPSLKQRRNSWVELRKTKTTTAGFVVVETVTKIK